MSFDLKKMYFLGVGIIALALAVLFPNIIVSLIVTLGFGVYAFIKPKNALILLFLYIPIRPFIVKFNPELKAITDIIVLVILIKLFYDDRADWKSFFRFQWFEIAFFAFCFLGAVSAFITGASPLAIIFQLHAFGLFYLVYYIVKRLEITKEDIKTFLWTVVVTVILICIEAFIEKFMMKEGLFHLAWPNRTLSATNSIRLYGMTGDPNTLALYLSLSFIPLLYLRNFLAGKSRWILNGTLVLLLSVETLTYSRGIWLAFIIALVVYMFLAKNWPVLKTFIITLAVAIVVVSLPANLITDQIEHMASSQNDEEGDETGKDDSSISGRMTRMFNGQYAEASSQRGRIFFINKGFEVFFDHPVIGTGFATFGDSATLGSGSPIYDDYDIGWQFYSDNQYIEVIAETGVIGVILFAIFLLNMLYLLWKKRHDSPFFPVLIAFLLGAYVAGSYYNVWENDRMTLYYFAMLGLLFNVHPRTSLRLLQHEESYK